MHLLQVQRLPVQRRAGAHGQAATLRRATRMHRIAARRPMASALRGVGNGVLAGFASWLSTREQSALQKTPAIAKVHRGFHFSRN